MDKAYWLVCNKISLEGSQSQDFVYTELSEAEKMFSYYTLQGYECQIELCPINSIALARKLKNNKESA